MADRPILFSGPMVRALLAGRKTQTRRVLKIDTPTDADEVFYWPREGRAKVVARYGDNVAEEGIWARKVSTNLDHDGDNHWGELANGYVRFLGRSRIEVGDRLWVREAWRSFRRSDHLPPHEMKPQTIWYEADGGDGQLPHHESAFGRLRPSMYMPRWASRLTLIVTEVRIERLQQITSEDALAEGIVRHGRFYGLEDADWDDAVLDPREAFGSLWERINGKRGCGWYVDPLVTAVTFTVGKHNIDEAQP